mmetsp:Transcript_18000/g.29823  ORF Transcript_18000/g.29823 Transcript_18000/m.29823 type:complete len:227 (-) Transcript_18000:2169-2849(-)
MMITHSSDTNHRFTYCFIPHSLDTSLEKGHVSLARRCRRQTAVTAHTDARSQQIIDTSTIHRTQRLPATIGIVHLAHRQGTLLLQGIVVSVNTNCQDLGIARNANRVGRIGTLVSGNGIMRHGPILANRIEGENADNGSAGRPLHSRNGNRFAIVAQGNVRSIKVLIVELIKAVILIIVVVGIRHFDGRNRMFGPIRLVVVERVHFRHERIVRSRHPKGGTICSKR